MLLIDKPVGMSSFGVVARVRRNTGVRKVGHAGTLDPLASGLMLVLVGKDETKQASHYIGLDKTYETVVRIGESRSTGDLEGGILNKVYVENLTRETVERALERMVGILKLPVPTYSAVKKNGNRLYALARKGKTITPPMRDMRVYSAKLSNLTCHNGVCDVYVTFSVASGVYIRSLSEELGRLVGYPATTANLRRTRIGEYSIADAVTIDS